MKIAIASDHRGFDAKKKLVPHLERGEHQLQDFGCPSTASCDYVDFAAPAARSVAKGEMNVAILLEGSGIGMSITANKIHGIRAALVHDEITARRAREHHHCNVLCLGTELLSEEQIRNIVQIFLSSSMLQNDRHLQRISKVTQVECDG